MILFENKSATISLDETVPCIEWIAKDAVISSEFRESLFEQIKHVKELIKRIPNLKDYVDLRKFQAVSEDDIQFPAKVSDPLFYEAGIRYRAFVMPVDLFSQLNFDAYMERTSDSGIIIKNFTSPEEARSWLKSIK